MLKIPKHYIISMTFTTTVSAEIISFQTKSTSLIFTVKG